jgi:hypothetical protein
MWISLYPSTLCDYVHSMSAPSQATQSKLGHKPTTSPALEQKRVECLINWAEIFRMHLGSCSKTSFLVRYPEYDPKYILKRQRSKRKRLVQTFYETTNPQAIVKDETNKCTSSISFFSHLFPPTSFGRRSTIIRVLDIKDTVSRMCYPILKSSYCVMFYV